MTSLDHLLGVLHFWSLVSLGWFWLFVCWKPYRLDALREQLFSLRDELFLEACDDEHFNFEHPAYRCLRDDLNSMIRFAEKMTLCRALAIWLFMPRDVLTQLSSWEKDIQGLPLHAQKNILRIRQAATSAVANHVVYGSPVLLALRILSQVNHYVRKFYNRVRSWIARPLEAQARDQYRLAS
jgi:hypothetical protein